MLLRGDCDILNAIYFFIEVIMLTQSMIILIVLLSTAYKLVLNIVEYRSASNPTPANV